MLFFLPQQFLTGVRSFRDHVFASGQYQADDLNRAFTLQSAAHASVNVPSGSAQNEIKDLAADAGGRWIGHVYCLRREPEAADAPGFNRGGTTAVRDTSAGPG